MFLTQSHYPASLYPSHSKISESDWKILSRFWYPVAVVGDLGDQPVRAKLLDVDLVLYRSTGGITAAVDICPHRFIRLSAGQVSNGEIICPFHGLRFDGDGKCTRVPALGRDASLPASYRVRTFRTSERYGLLWCCLDDESDEALPEFPALTAAGDDHLTYALVLDWPISAARQVENFIDLAHLPFVHAATLGGDQAAALAPPRIEQRNDSVVFHAKYDETGENGTSKPCEYTYRVVPPFAVDFTVVSKGQTLLRSADIPAPISAYESRVFQITVTAEPSPSNRSQPSVVDVVNQEDIQTLSNLAIPDLPLDQKREIHLPVDSVSLAYRKRLQQLGLGESA